MSKVNTKRFYSLLEAQKFTGIKSRQYLSKYIDEGKLIAIQTGSKNESIRYSIKGDWLLDFIDRYKHGNIKGKQYSKKEIKARLEEAIKNLK